jgi:hypothetical protein
MPIQSENVTANVSAEVKTDMNVDAKTANAYANANAGTSADAKASANANANVKGNANKSANSNEIASANAKANTSGMQTNLTRRRILQDAACWYYLSPRILTPWTTLCRMLQSGAAERTLTRCVTRIPRKHTGSTHRTHAAGRTLQKAHWLDAPHARCRKHTGSALCIHAAGSTLARRDAFTL